MRYIIATHTSYQNGVEIHGPAHTIYSFLKEKGLNNLFIRHPLNPRKDDIYILKNGENDRKIRAISSIPALDNIFELLVNAYEVLKVKEEVYFVGIDPLNALSGILCRLFFWKKIKVVYYIVDFSDTRFRNKLMNSVYTLLDKISCKYSHEVWCVSTRICTKKIEQGVEKQKVQFVPNSPHMQLDNKLKPYNGNLNCILIAQLNNCVDFTAILEVIKIVHISIPAIRLKVIGDGKEKFAFEQLAVANQLQNCVEFMGALSHKRVLDELGDAFVGFAIYTNSVSWNVYGDSMKAREYLAFGLPVIINNVPSTADEIQESNAGLVIDHIDPRIIASFVIEIVRNKALYSVLRQNAYSLAIKHGKERLLGPLLLGSISQV